MYHWCKAGGNTVWNHAVSRKSELQTRSLLVSLTIHTKTFRQFIFFFDIFSICYTVDKSDIENVKLNSMLIFSAHSNHSSDDVEKPYELTLFETGSLLIYLHFFIPLEH